MNKKLLFLVISSVSILNSCSNAANSNLTIIENHNNCTELMNQYQMKKCYKLEDELHFCKAFLAKTNTGEIETFFQGLWSTDFGYGGTYYLIKEDGKLFHLRSDLSRIFSLKPYDRTDSFIVENSEITGGYAFADYLKFRQEQGSMDEIECETTQDGNTIQGQITIGDETFTKILREAHQSARVKIKVNVQTKKN